MPVTRTTLKTFFIDALLYVMLLVVNPPVGLTAIYIPNIVICQVIFGRKEATYPEGGAWRCSRRAFDEFGLFKDR